MIICLEGRCFLALDWDSKVKEKYYDDQVAEVTSLYSCLSFQLEVGFHTDETKEGVKLTYI